MEILGGSAKHQVKSEATQAGSPPAHGNDVVYKRALGHRNDDHMVFLVRVDLVISLLMHDCRPAWLLPTHQLPCRPLHQAAVLGVVLGASGRLSQDKGVN